MQAIVAVDRNWGIGYKGSLLVSIPNDHKMFRQETKGKTIIYGRKTLETFPMAQPLDQRRNVILSGNPAYTVRGAEVVHSIEELLELLKDEDPDSLMVIGGASVYKELLPYCDTIHVTMVDYAYEAGNSEAAENARGSHGFCGASCRVSRRLRKGGLCDRAGPG